ncbi:MAG: hypothetical protein NTY02_05135 [Acidobacteria bacterium]|nr:hypothetical protein [Acidobacteriota bacterium]
MGRLVRVVIAALVLFALWHAAAAEWRQFQFEAAVKEIAQFGADREEGAVHAEVMAAAAKLGVPVAAERLTVRREADHVFIDLEYVAPIEILPRYFYPWTFKVSAQGWFVPGGRIPPR